jgi:hypothetical protein
MEATIQVYAPEILSDLLELGELGAQPLDLMLDGGPTRLPHLTKWTLYFGKISYFIQHFFICRPSDSTV